MSGGKSAAARLRCANSTGVWSSSDECGRSWLWRWRCSLPSTFASSTEANASRFRNSSRNRQLKTLAAGVLPRAARLDVERLEPAPRDPLLHCQRHELPVPSGTALRAKAPPFGYLAPLDSGPLSLRMNSGTHPRAATAASRMRMTSRASIRRSTSSATNSRLNSSQIGSHLSRRPSSV